MTPEQFKHWIAGFMAALDGAEMTPKQAQVIAQKAATVGSGISFGNLPMPKHIDDHKTVAI